MYKLFFYILIYLFALNVWAQKDTLQIQSLLDKAYEFEVSEPRKALKIYQDVYQLSLKNKYYLGVFKSLQYSGMVHNDNGNYDSAFYYYEKSKPYAKKANYPRGEALTYINAGNTHQFMGNYNKAVSYYLSGIKLLETLQDSMALSQSYQNISALYGTLKNNKLKILYLQKAVEYSDPKNQKQIAGLYCDLGLTFLQQQNPVEALVYFKKTDVIGNKLEDKTVIFLAKRNLGEYYNYKKQYDKAIFFYEMAFQIGAPTAVEKNDLLYILSGVYFKMKNYSKAESYAHESVKLSKALKTREILYKSYRKLAEIYHATNRRDTAYDYLVESMNLKDSVMNEGYLKQISLIQTQYETEKKDKAIAEQQIKLERNEVQLLKKQNQSTYYLIAVLILGLLSLGIWLVFRQRQRVKNREIFSLKQQQEIAKLEALIDGEEKERRRIAQELHDGINGDLSAIKYRLSGLEDSGLNEEDRKSLSKTIEMIDSACSQIRGISHNLMPSSILDFGLVETVNEYCAKINNSHPLKLEYQYFGNPAVLPKKAETVIYRIIQELINNITKHSKATIAMVQLNFHESELFITVEDNGIGFDPKSVQSGLGLKNIHSRVHFLNAQLEMDSNDKGSSFHITIDLNSLKND